MLNNFFFGLQSLATNILEFGRQLSNYELFWGFSIGFLVSTMVHVFLLSEDRRYACGMILKKRLQSFEHRYPPEERLNAPQLFEEHNERVTQLRSTFLLVLLLFVFVLLIAVITG